MKRLLFGLVSLCLSLNAFAQSSIYVGSWSGVIESASLEIVFNVSTDKSSFDVPGESAFGLPLIVKETPVGVRFDVPPLMAYFEGVYFNKSIVGSFYQAGQQYPMTLKPYTPKPVSRPQNPKGPFSYSSSEVSFTNGNATLAGTLVLPQNANTDTPIVLFVTGSGAQNRDEELLEHKPFWVLADALANAGIASLRYDDRGFAASTGDRNSATTDTLAVDALKGIQYLKSLGYKRVGIIGHSEGGTIAFMLGAQNAVDFIVSLAGMAETGEQTILHQTYAISIAQGADDATAKAATQTVLKQMQTQAGVWGNRFVELNPADYLKDVKCPMLALNGENDKNVLYEYNIPIIKTLVPHAQIKTYPGLNHLFQPSKNGTASEYYSIETTIKAEVIEDIISFILAL